MKMGLIKYVKTRERCQVISATFRKPVSACRLFGRIFCFSTVICIFVQLTSNQPRSPYRGNAHDTLARNSHRKLARVIRRWKLANVTCFPALVFSSCGNLARYSAMLYFTLESGVNGTL